MEYLNQLTDSDLIAFYGKFIAELKKRTIIRTKNIVGDLGERFAIDYYTKTEQLPNLFDAPPSSKNVDALGENKKLYAIKSTSGTSTGAFYGLPDKESTDNPTQLFDYLLIVVFNDFYGIEAIYELTWQQFLEHKKWHSRMKTWYVPVNNIVRTAAKITYKLVN